MLALVAIAVISGCVQHGTGTANIRTKLNGNKLITVLYVSPLGTPDTIKEISSPLDYDDPHSEIGIIIFFYDGRRSSKVL